MNDYRSIPSVDKLLRTEAAIELLSEYGRPLTVEAVRTVLDEIRGQNEHEQGIPMLEKILSEVAIRLKEWFSPTLIPVINASGVILHTNLGRAPLSRSALEALQQLCAGYSNLEYDLEHGKRGSRLIHAELQLTRLTGTEAALVVNNNAAAVLLILTALARRRRVVISRTQLVEIGGGFRVPDVMKQSGARLVEVGTTNRVHLTDYEEVLAEQGVSLLMRAHHSNFRLIGFTNEPTIKELVQIAHKYNVPVIDDLGSGALLETEKYALAHEPTVQESVSAGADIICFSGDKLLGGPQAGIIVGRKELINKIKKHPLARAVRADKLCLAALTATLQHYRKNEAESEIPIWQMISMPEENAVQRIHKWIESIGMGTIISGNSTVGGGSLPEELLPTKLLAIEVAQPNKFLERLRKCSPPVIARIEKDQVMLDPRTVLPHQDNDLINNILLVKSIHRQKK